jgi:SAM-dependent methyltransferase
MNDSLRAAYDAIPYHHGAVPDSHPARLGVIARLHGIAAAAPDGCRVVELGCGEGMNLLPFAERLPHAQFTGVDFSPVQIATAEAARAACGIANARFLCADLRTFEPEGEFDYIIAHGVYSWVPDDVKDRLLAICARALAPNGVAYVSYNTLPGWSLLAGLRQFLLGEISHEPDPPAKLAHATRVLAALDQAAAGQPGSYAAMLREAIADMRAKPPTLLFHDELAAINDPVTFRQFTAHAARHGLAYLAEAHYATMPYEHVPAPIRGALAGLQPDFFRAQQFMDVIFQRWLRNSLLVAAPSSPSHGVNPCVIHDCALGLRLRPAPSSGNASLDPGSPLQLLGPNDLSFTFDTPFEKAFFTTLVEAAPARIPFSQALETTHLLLRGANLPINPSTAPTATPAPQANSMSTTASTDLLPLYGTLYRLFALDALDLVLTGDGAWLRNSAAPTPSPLMRHQAISSPTVTNRWHEPVTLTGEGPHALLAANSPSHSAALAKAGLLV